MKNKQTAGWVRDAFTGLSLIPSGTFVDFSPYAAQSELPSAVRGLSVLRGDFQAQYLDVVPDMDAHVGWGTVMLEDTFALTFRVQLGSDILYWLANPADVGVWQVIDAWGAAKRMLLAAHLDDGREILLCRDFAIAPEVERLRRLTKVESKYTPAFIGNVAVSLVTNEAKDMASSDLLAYPVLVNFQACLVTTEVTMPVGIDLAPGIRTPY